MTEAKESSAAGCGAAITQQVAAAKAAIIAILLIG
jgi:hypothetical protein